MCNSFIAVLTDTVNDCISKTCISLCFSVNVLSRLMDPTQCPSNLIHREECQCRRDYTAAGLSTFTRVRLDLSKMTVISESNAPSHTRCSRLNDGSAKENLIYTRASDQRWSIGQGRLESGWNIANKSFFGKSWDLLMCFRILSCKTQAKSSEGYRNKSRQGLLL